MGTVNITITPAISGIYIVLEDKDLNKCQTLTTDSLGRCSFLNLPAGNYSVYNVGIEPDACPPTKCGYPSGYTGTTTPRRRDFTLTSTGTSTQSFTYDKPIPWSTYNAGNPPTFAMTTSNGADLATGALITLPKISNNGMGYCMQDNFIYGSSGRSSVGVTTPLSYPYTYDTHVLIGDCDDNGYFYSPATGKAFTCINVNSYSPGYLRACNPYNNFIETKAPYYVTYGGTGTFSSADWAYVPSINSIVGNNNNNFNELFVLSLSTPTAYFIPVVGTKPQVTGIAFSDNKNFYQPTGTNILKFQIFTTVAYGTVLSPSTLSYVGDGCRAVGAPVFYAAPQIVKHVDKGIATLKDTLIYTVTIVNTGIVPGIASIFSDTLPDGLSFIENSLTLDGTTVPNGNPNRLNIGSLPIGKVFTVTFMANILSNTIIEYNNYGNINATYFDNATEEIFDSNFLSNIVTTTVIGNYVSTSKFLDKTFGKIDDILTYTIATNNTGISPIHDLIIVDTIPIGTTFVPGSLYVDGINKPTSTIAPPLGYLFGTLDPGAITTVTFKVSIVSIPNNNIILNYGTASYNNVTPFGNANFFVDTNTVATIIKYAVLGTIKKYVDKRYATVGDTILYTIAIPNTGNVTATNAIFVDTIPEGCSFVPGSLTVNGEFNSSSPQFIILPDIPPNDIVTISYKILINKE